MAGFLDKNTRVIDMVLTDYGRELYSKNELEFSYYAFSDDEVDYDPYVSTSGSITNTQLTASKGEQIEATLVREAVFGLQKGMNSEARDQTNIKNMLFTMPQGQKILPRISTSPELTSGSIGMKQQRLQDIYVTLDQSGNVITKSGPFDRGFKKFNSSRLEFSKRIEDYFDKASHEGNLVRVFVSASNGLTEVVPKRDKKGVLSYNCDMRLFKDEETKNLRKSDSDKIESLTRSIGFSKERR